MRVNIYKLANLMVALNVIFLPIKGWGQTTYDSTQIDSSLNSYLACDITFTSNNIKSNTYTSEQIPATMADLSFYHKSGLWAGLMPVYYHNTPIITYDLDASVGFQKFFSTYFDANAFYTYHSFQGNNEFEGLDYQHSFNLSLGADFSWLYIFADGYSYHGTSNNYFTDVGLALYYDFKPFKKRSDYISIMPIISISFGTDYWFFDDLSDTESRYYINYWERWGYDSQNFGFYSFDFMIPINYQMNNFSFSAAYSYSIPANKYKEIDWQNQWGIMFSLGYMLNFKKI